MPRAKPYTKEDLIRAMKHSKSIRGAAKYLGCTYQHIKPYFKMYKDDDGISFFDKHYNQTGKGIIKWLGNKQKEPNLQKILETSAGWESFTIQKIKSRLIAENYLMEECYNCGFHEKRVTDYRVPLLLNFKDRNKKNYLYDNLELLCYNCYFLYIADPLTPDHIKHIEENAEVKAKPYDWEIDEVSLKNMAALGIGGIS